MENHINEPDNSGEIQDIVRDEKGRFIEGHSGNPAGKPRGTVSITTEIRNKLSEIPVGQKSTYLELLISRILKQAVVEGNEQMIKLIWNYIEGMPEHRISIDQDY